MNPVQCQSDYNYILFRSGNKPHQPSLFSLFCKVLTGLPFSRIPSKLILPLLLLPIKQQRRQGIQERLSAEANLVALHEGTELILGGAWKPEMALRMSLVSSAYPTKFLHFSPQRHQFWQSSSGHRTVRTFCAGQPG